MIIPMDLGIYGVYGQHREKSIFEDAILKLQKSGLYYCNGDCVNVENSDGIIYERTTPNKKQKIIQGIDLSNIDEDSLSVLRPNKKGK